jgi:hypothetical protein
MKKVYLIQSSTDDYDYFDRVYTTKESAEKYIKEMNTRPEFITDDFVDDWEDAIYDSQEKYDLVKHRYDFETPEEYEKYRTSVMEQSKQYAIELLNQKGYKINSELYDKALEWEDRLYSNEVYNITEIDLYEE